MTARLFVDAHVFDGEYQGTRTYIKELYKQILRKKPGWEIYFGALTPDKIKEEISDFPNAHFVNYTSHNKYFRLLIDIPALIKKHAIDYAHFQYVAPPVKCCNYVVTIHDLLFKDFSNEFTLSYRVSKNLLFRYSAKKADILMTVSNYSRQRIVVYYKLNENNIIVVPDGVSEKFTFHADQSEARQLINERFGINDYILYVSRIEPRKNHDALLRAYCELELWKKNIHLVFIGKETIKNTQFELIKKDLNNAIIPYIHNYTTIDNDDLYLFYRAARLFVFPSKGEGFGIPPLEAAALGVPVICSNATALADFSFFGTNLVDPYDIDDIKRKIALNIDKNDYSTLHEISKIVRTKYSWEHSADTFIESIERHKAGRSI